MSADPAELERVADRIAFDTRVYKYVWVDDSDATTIDRLAELLCLPDRWARLGATAWPLRLEGRQPIATLLAALAPDVDVSRAMSRHDMRSLLQDELAGLAGGPAVFVLFDVGRYVTDHPRQGYEAVDICRMCADAGVRMVVLSSGTSDPYAQLLRSKFALVRSTGL